MIASLQILYHKEIMKQFQNIYHLEKLPWVYISILKKKSKTRQLLL